MVPSSNQTLFTSIPLGSASDPAPSAPSTEAAAGAGSSPYVPASQEGKKNGLDSRFQPSLAPAAADIWGVTQWLFATFHINRLKKEDMKTLKPVAGFYLCLLMLRDSPNRSSYFWAHLLNWLLLFMEPCRHSFSARDARDAFFADPLPLFSLSNWSPAHPSRLRPSTLSLVLVLSSHAPVRIWCSLSLNFSVPIFPITVSNSIFFFLLAHLPAQGTRNLWEGFIFLLDHQGLELCSFVWIMSSMFLPYPKHLTPRLGGN